MKELLEKILEEVDPEIKEFMLSDSNVPILPSSITGVVEGYVKRWEFLTSPVMEILMWQELRDRRKYDKAP